MRAQANGIELEYEALGPENLPPVVLIMGLGAQMVRWPDSLIEELLSSGFRVIRFDNRDCGMSTSMEAGGIPELAKILSQEQKPPYTLREMALDVVGLLDWLGIRRAHIVGTSMGGMIAQVVACEHPDRVLSLTSIMASTGNSEVSPPDPGIFEQLTKPRPDPSLDVEAYVDSECRREMLIASPAFPPDQSRLRARILLELQRGFNPNGVARQMAAVWSSGDRRPELIRINVPTLIYHGLNDPLIPPDSGEDTAKSIPNARLMLVAGMAHDLPDERMPGLCSAILALAQEARREAARRTSKADTAPLE
jgi:pimeloyl-ACP methyl ester carboxylesterase